MKKQQKSVQGGYICTRVRTKTVFCGAVGASKNTASGRAVPPLNKSVQRNRILQKPGHSPKRQTARKRKQRQRIIVSSSVLASILLITIIVVICKSGSDGKENLAALQGVWHYNNQYTEYEFDGRGSGCMCIE